MSVSEYESVCVHDEWQICIILSKRFHDNAARPRGASKGGRGGKEEAEGRAVY